MNLWKLAAFVLPHVPMERLLTRPRDRSESLRKLQEIVQGSETSTPPVEGEERPSRQRRSSPGLSSEDTIAYQNREIGKLLLRMERHYAQRLRVNGIPCDCGSQKHLLDLESLCEETIPMVREPRVYYDIIEWVTEVGPKSTDEAAKSGLYDEEYPAFSHRARDFRKGVIGSLNPEALFPQRLEDRGSSQILPVVSDEERERIREMAHQKIEEVLE